MSGAVINTATTSPPGDADVKRREANARHDLAHRMATAYPSVPPSVVAEAMRAEYERYTHARIRDFVPVLVERAVRLRLIRLTS
jgi:hypothetical protein